MAQPEKANWQRGLLGDLLPIKYGKSLPEKLRDASGSHPVFGSSGRIGVHSSPLTEGPTLVIGRKGNVGAVHYSTVPCWPIDTAYYVETPAGQNLRYYKYLLESLNLVRLDRSTAIPGLSRDDYNAVEVVISPPEQQDDIVAEIEKQFSRLDEAVAGLKRVKANLKRYKAAILKVAVEGRLVPTEANLARREGRDYETGTQLLQRILETRRSQWQGKGKYKEPAAPDTADLPELPKGWVYATAEQLTDENRAITYGVIKLGDTVDSGVPVLRSSDVRWLKVELGGVKTISSEIAANYQRTFLRGGEVVMTVRGTLGGIAVVPPECRGFNVSREVAMLALVEPAMANTVAYFIASSPIQRWLMGRTKGIAYTGINIETLKGLPLPVPPLAEQHRIVAEVDRLLSIAREVEAEVDANLKRAQALRQAILARAFQPAAVPPAPTFA